MPKFLLFLAPDDGGQAGGGGSLDSAAASASAEVSSSPSTTEQSSQSVKTAPARKTVQNVAPKVEESWLDLEDEKGKKLSFKSKDDFLREHKNFMMLQSDYTRKRQADEEARKKWESERDMTMKEIMQQKQRYDEYNKFLKENPHIYKKLEELKRQGTTPDVAVMKAQSYVDEKYQELQNKLSEFEKREQEREKAEQRKRIFESLKGKYQDFDADRIEKEFSFIDPSNPEHIYETLYYAMKGKMNPAQLERKLAESQQQKQQARLLSGGGSSTSSPNKSFKSLDDALAAAMSEV